MVDIDVGMLSEAINDKADRDLNNTQPLARTVVEVSDKSLMPSWYRIYSDGWCEQGGRTPVSNSTQTVTISKDYIDMNFSVNLTTIRNTNNAYSDNIEILTNNSFKIYNGAITAFIWETSGYII